ncbi:AraC family transcriptional regulator [Pedobacter sp. MC2016-24]|uniref:helix-turn-helix domain-containing protein n=1 Tax=Pedobacter sp. MC2016-24 TaxID=2780090 RepID=UPI00188079F1|nr:AraC family transcriptional regulator [Pedobacter sp. MC2016-24]MBE9598040.1 helix-turn-helix transcriptional regulator [Pedobacter sp. MC2016-24]
MNLDDLNFGNAFLYSCYVDNAFGHEQFVSEHVISFQISGETHIDHQNGVIVLKEGQLMISHRNQLAKAFKYPAKNKEYRSLSVMLHTGRIRKFGMEHHYALDKKYQGLPNILLQSNPFLDSFFQSLVPYVEQTSQVSKQMETVKVNEILTLLLETYPELSTFLFDFSEPFKIDLEEFMQKNYQYNVPIENFAKLTGRSLASFKRDFQKIFETSPRKWLQEKRLSEAYNILKKKQKKPTDIYLDLGFENLSHFYSSFKEKFGVTPSMVI